MVGDIICYKGKKERRERGKIAKIVPGGKGDLSGEACLPNTSHGGVTLIKNRRTPYSSNSQPRRVSK